MLAKFIHISLFLQADAAAKIYWFALTIRINPFSCPTYHAGEALASYCSKRWGGGKCDKFCISNDLEKIARIVPCLVKNDIMCKCAIIDNFSKYFLISLAHF